MIIDRAASLARGQVELLKLLEPVDDRREVMLDQQGRLIFPKPSEAQNGARDFGLSELDAFFHQRDAFREPAWMHAPRGPDVSPGMRWYPVVTSMQLALDMILADGAPMGYGHVYAPSHYIDAWLDVTGIDDWSPAEIQALKRALDTDRRTSIEKNRGSG